MRAKWAKGERKRLYGLMLGVSALALLVACDDDRPVNAAKARPGVERQVAASGSLPAASAGRQYDVAVAPVDETRTGPRIGSVVAERGGQKAQLEAAAREAAKRDAEIREAREARDRTERAAVAERTARDSGQPPTQAAAAPPPAAITTATVPPAAPTDAASSPAPRPEPAVAVATTPARPADPNKAFEPPPGWVPPGQAAPVNVSVTAPTPAAPPVQTASAAPPPPTPAVTTTAVAPPPPVVEAAPMPAPAAPARRADPNKAFEPPAGWVPPAAPEPANVQTASVQPATVPPPVVERPSAPATMPAVAAPPRRVDANKAFEPPPGWTPPAAPAPVVQTAAAAPPVVQQAPAPPPPVAPVVTSPVPPPPVTAVAVPTPVPVVAAPPMSTKADVSRAMSGEVPAGVLKSQPLGGQLQIAVIQFNRSSSGLGGNDQSVLTKVAQIHKKNGGTVRIVAHAAKDVTGSSVGDIESGNYEVSKRRALAIAGRLMALGVPRSAIVAEAASDGEPIYETNTARGLAANRRAEVFLDF